MQTLPLRYAASFPTPTTIDIIVYIMNQHQLFFITLVITLAGGTHTTHATLEQGTSGHKGLRLTLNIGVTLGCSAMVIILAFGPSCPRLDSKHSQKIY